MMYNWFECKVVMKSLWKMEDKKRNEPYLVDALSFTEAEARILKKCNLTYRRVYGF